jgi:hypothetical protein
MREAALDDHTVPFTGAVVADGAVNIESFLATLEKVGVERQGKFRDVICADHSSVKSLIEMKVAAGNGAGDYRAGGHIVWIKGTGFEWFMLGLFVHSLAASDGADGD